MATNDERDLDRRGFGRVIAGAGALLAGLFSLPGLAGLLHPVLEKRDGGWVDAAAVADITAGGAKTFAYTVRAGWEQRELRGFLVREGDAIVAFSDRCTHLGCKLRPPVAKQDEAPTFRCPCHGGVFDLAGAPQAGPVTKPMVRFPTRVQNGRVQVQV